MTPHELTRGEPDVARLRELYARLELRSLLRQLPAGNGAETFSLRADALPAGAVPVEPATRANR